MRRSPSEQERTHMSMAGAPGPAPITPVDAVKKAIDNYANFDGRSTRPEFWWFYGALVVIGVVLYVIDLAIFGFPILSGLFWLATLVPYIAVGIRRFHDTDKSGWWILTGFIPCVGFIILIVLLAQPGTPGPNQYGPPPA